MCTTAAAARRWVPGPTPKGWLRCARYFPRIYRSLPGLCPAPPQHHQPFRLGGEMSWPIVVLLIALPTVVLIAWALWLIFAALIAKWHGPSGLAAVRHVAEGFKPREWALLIPRGALMSGLM